MSLPLLAIAQTYTTLPAQNVYDATVKQMQKEAAEQAARDAARRATLDAGNPANDQAIISTVVISAGHTRRVHFESKKTEMFLGQGTLLKDEGVMDTGMPRKTTSHR